MMCLDSVDKRVSLKEPERERIGWKAFDTVSYNGNVRGEYFQRWYKPGKWYNASNRKIIFHSIFYESKTYESGFHVFVKRKDVEEWSRNHWTFPRKIKYRNVVATGHQRGIRMHVAKEMIVLPDGGKVD